MSWSQKYKKSIDCDNPRGFSQRAHCQGKKKSFKEMREYMYGFSLGPTDIQKPMASMGSSGQFFPNRRYATTMPALSANYSGRGIGTYKPMVTAQKIKTPAIKPDFRSTGEKNIKRKQKD